MPEVRLTDKTAIMEQVRAIEQNSKLTDAQKFRQAKFVIENVPTIEAEPVRHGRWIDVPDANTKVAKCSLCGFWQRTNGDDKTGNHLIHTAVYRYCAGCGARMDGGDEQ